MQNIITRRVVVKAGLMVGAIAPSLALICTTASAVGADLPPLDPKDAAAVTLGFTNDSASVDAAANPTHATDQNCANCEQYLGKQKDAKGGCVLFAGKSVPAAGWCRVWRKTTKT
jgi:High potential iron-sulfur protein